MSETPDQDSKTEEATEKRINDAIAKGNVPVSRETGIVVSLFAMLLAMSLFAGHQLHALTAILRRFLENPGGLLLPAYEDAGTFFLDLTLRVFAVLSPVLLLFAGAGVLAAAMQNPLSIALDRIKPKLSKISLKQGWKRLFGANGWIEFAKAVGKFAIIGTVSFLVMRSDFDALTGATYLPPEQLLVLIHRIVLWLIASVAAAALVIAIGDILWSRYDWRRNLRMTVQEVKDEMKDVDGNPLIKLRFRSLARDRLRRRMMSAVPTATMIITNPTHFAVALRYVKDRDEAPVVVAKGMDLIALKIREVARDHGIPMIEDKPLARSLYDNVEIDQMIPVEFFNVVAKLILHLEASRKFSLR